LVLKICHLATLLVSVDGRDENNVSKRRGKFLVKSRLHNALLGSKWSSLWFPWSTFVYSSDLSSVNCISVRNWTITKQTFFKWILNKTSFVCHNLFDMKKFSLKILKKWKCYILVSKQYLVKRGSLPIVAKLSNNLELELPW
jgi:hypothetical protein